MEVSREIYWNVGHQVTTLLPMYLLALGAIGVLGDGFLRRLRHYRRGGPGCRHRDISLVREFGRITP